MVTEEMVIQCLQLTKSFDYLDLVSMYKLVYMTSNSLKNNVYEFNGTFNIDYIMVHLNRRTFNKHNCFIKLCGKLNLTIKQCWKLVVSIIIQKPYLKGGIETDNDPLVEVDDELYIPNSYLSDTSVVLILSCWVGSTHIFSKKVPKLEFYNILTKVECNVQVQGLMSYVWKYVKNNKVHEVPTLKLHALNLFNFKVCSLYEMKYS